LKQCKNCDQVGEGEYCSACGQRHLEQLDFATMRAHVQEFFDLERGYLKVTVDLFRRPGELLRSYIGGATRRYANPVTFFLTTLTISMLVSYWSTKFQEGRGLEDVEVWQTKAIVIGLVFTNAVLHRWFFRNPPYSFYERLAASAYAMAGYNIVSAVIDIVESLATELYYYTFRWPSELGAAIGLMMLSYAFFYGSLHGPGVLPRIKGALMAPASLLFLVLVFGVGFWQSMWVLDFVRYVLPIAGF
jgi:hypothetical protein